MIHLKLFFIFFKIGLFSIGGGLATLPFLQDLVDNYGWITSKELIDMIAISESTPGAIGINTATFVGYKVAGISGGILTSLGLVAPSIIIIILIAHYFKKFNEKPLVQGAFWGLRPAVTGLIASVCFEIIKISILSLEKYNLNKNILDIVNFKESVLFILVMYLIHKYKKHPILYLAGAAVIGIIFKF
jgi:chromate transporter